LRFEASYGGEKSARFHFNRQATMAMHSGDPSYLGGIGRRIAVRGWTSANPGENIRPYLKNNHKAKWAGDIDSSGRAIHTFRTETNFTRVTLCCSLIFYNLGYFIVVLMHCLPMWPRLASNWQVLVLPTCVAMPDCIIHSF
jgi:hypothetical protein